MTWKVARGNNRKEEKSYTGARCRCANLPLENPSNDIVASKHQC